MKFKFEVIKNNVTLNSIYTNFAKNVGKVKSNGEVLLSVNISGVVYGNVTYLNQ